jgi:hypothetical protein
MFGKQLSLEQLETKKQTLTAALGDAQRTLQEVEAGLSLALIDGDESGVQEVGTKRARVEGLRMALSVLEKQRPGAVLNEKRRGLLGLRGELEAKCSELATIEKRTTPLLKQLSAVEGVRFEAGILACQRQGEWYSQGLRSPEPYEGAFVDCAPDPNNRQCVAVPRSKHLRLEIAGLKGKIAAAELELTPEPAAVQAPAAELKNWSDSSYSNRPTISEPEQQ